MVLKREIRAIVTGQRDVLVSLFSPLLFFRAKYKPKASKTQKKKVMMFGAVYRPRPDLGERWDGKLMLKVAHRKKVPSFTFLLLFPSTTPLVNPCNPLLPFLLSF
jgi:hypothetical protein